MFISLFEKEEKDNGFIEKGTTEGWLIWYCIRTLMNFARGSKFKREYIDHKHEPYNSNDIEIQDEEYDYHYDVRLSVIMESSMHIGELEMRLFEKYADGENISDFSRKSGIPRKTLINIINKVKLHLKNKVKQHDSINGNPCNDIHDRIQSVWQLELF